MTDEKNKSGKVAEKNKSGKVAEKNKSGKVAPVLLLFGYWPKEGGEKIAKGTKIDLPLDEAKALIAGGKAERADPLPGDD